MVGVGDGLRSGEERRGVELSGRVTNVAHQGHTSSNLSQH